MAASMGDLSEAILDWLDWRPESSGSTPISHAWNTKPLRIAFSSSLESTLQPILKAGISPETITQLVVAFRLPRANSSLVRLERQGMEPTNKLTAKSFDVMRGQISEILEVSPQGEISGASAGTLADKIVEALQAAVKNVPGWAQGEQAFRPVEYPSSANTGRPRFKPEIRVPLILTTVPLRVRRKYHVRLALVVLGMVIATLIFLGVVKPDSWLNPATGLFLVLGYVTLTVTAALHGRERASDS